MNTTVVPRSKADDWFWWKSATAPPEVDPQQMLRAFLPLMRVSKQFAHTYPKTMQDPRWSGHYEFTIPTAAIVDGLAVEDIGGDGPFCPKGRRNLNYRNSRNTGNLCPGTFVWRPTRELYFVEAPETFPEPDLLYHPVKSGVPEWETQSDPEANAIAIVAPARSAASRAKFKQGNSRTVSVAMATYNGERHLGEQLESLACQDLAPDELIICDDGSTDSTVEIASEFALKAPFSVEITQNREKLGYSRNFITAVGRCRGELILFCDQDDVWSPQKISIVSRTAFAIPEQVISHDIAVFSDDPARPSFPSYFSHLRRSGLPPAVCIKGCATAVKAEFLSNWGWPRADADVSYDFWIALLATAFRQRRYVAQPLIKHRLHAENTSGWILSDAKSAASASAARRRRQSDTDLLVELCIGNWNLHWKEELPGCCASTVSIVRTRRRPACCGALAKNVLSIRCCPIGSSDIRDTKCLFTAPHGTRQARSEDRRSRRRRRQKGRDSRLDAHFPLSSADGGKNGLSCVLVRWEDGAGVQFHFAARIRNRTEPPCHGHAISCQLVRRDSPRTSVKTKCELSHKIALNCSVLSPAASLRRN